jgi:hypothetical protein
MTTVSFTDPHAGNLQINASISATANFGEVPSNGHPPIGTYFNFSDLDIPPGSYILEARLNTYQSNPYTHTVLAPSPRVTLNALFNIPVSSGNWTLRTYFYDETDIGHPGDGASIDTAQGTYFLSDSCFSSPTGQVSCNGNAQNLFTVNHKPGTAGQIGFSTSADSFGWGTDTVHLAAVLTSSLDPAETPEPGVWGLCSLGLAGIVVLRGRLA